MKADDEIKVRKRTFTYHESWIHFTLLFGNFVSFILFSVSNHFFCYFRLLKFTTRKNILNTVYTSDSIQQKRLPVSLEVGRIFF